ncbi:hypothetical protein FJZ31_15460 [Candidatus Poribacteria bacterium]|nr:hypothetical protein [Candidatus Poribacteria bacterium]
MSKITLTPIIVFVLIGLLVAYAGAAKIEELAPVDSLVYVTISELDEIWDAGAVSESWQSVFNADKADGSVSTIDQAMEVMRFTIGTDLRGIVETFGHQVAFVIMPPQSGKNELRMALILDTGGSRKEAEDIISKVNAVMAMNVEQSNTPRSGAEKSQTNPNAGRYRKIIYGTITLEKRTFKYGFIDDLLVIGLKEGGFEAIVDTYSKKTASITDNAKFKDIQKKFANVQLFGYANVDNALPLLKANEDNSLPPFSPLIKGVRGLFNGDTEKSKFEQTLQSKMPKFDLASSNLQSIDAIGFGIDAFSVDGLQRLYIQMKDPPLEKGGRRVSNTKDVVTSGLVNSMFHKGRSLDSLLLLRHLEAVQTSDVFFAMSSDNLNDLWQSFADNNDLQRGIQKLEDTSKLDFETEILGSLTGEIAVSANIADDIPQGAAKSIPWKELVVFMGLKERAKWEAAVNAMQKLTSTPTQKEYKYKSATVRKLSPPQNELFKTFGYGLTNETFIAAISTDKIQNIIDRTAAVNKSREPDTLLKQLPAPPSLWLDFNLNKLLPYILTQAKVDSKSTAQLKRNLGIGEYTVSPTSNGLWMCFRVISGKNLIDSIGGMASVVAP